MAIATSLTLPVVGALLIFSLMTGPPAAARSLTSSPLLAMGLSVVLAVVTVWVAIAAAFETNWPIGFFVGVGGAVCYAAGRLLVCWRPVPGIGQLIPCSWPGQEADVRT